MQPVHKNLTPDDFVIIVRPVRDDEEFNKFVILRDQELQLHFQHLKIENIEE